MPLPDVPVTLGVPTAIESSPGDTLRASVLTFAPGETYWARFGHNAILIENTATGANAVYNYGMFDFFQKNFFLNFARGHMLYRLDVDTLERTLALYASEGRWVRQQVLNLTPPQRFDLARFLDRNAQPDQAQYRYDYFRDNCSTRVRDAIDRVVGGAIAQRLKAEPVDVTYRHEATRLMRPIGPLALGMDAVMGRHGDQPITRWEQSFVPEVFWPASRSAARRWWPNRACGCPTPGASWRLPRPCAGRSPRCALGWRSAWGWRRSLTAPTRALPGSPCRCCSLRASAA